KQNRFTGSPWMWRGGQQAETGPNTMGGGGGGGWARHDQSQGLPMLCPSQSFRIPLARREESFSLSKAPASPPLPPLCKGGKGIARSRRHSIARNKNTRLEIVPPALSTPTFHRPSLALLSR